MHCCVLAAFLFCTCLSTTSAVALSIFTAAALVQLLGCAQWCRVTFGDLLHKNDSIASVKMPAVAADQACPLGGVTQIMHYYNRIHIKHVATGWLSVSDRCTTAAPAHDICWPG